MTAATRVAVGEMNTERNRTPTIIISIRSAGAAASVDRAKGGASWNQVRGLIGSLCFLCSESIDQSNITPQATLQTMPPTLQSTAMTPTC